MTRVLPRLTAELSRGGRESSLNRQFPGDHGPGLPRPLRAGLHGCEVDWTEGPKGWIIKERPGSRFAIKADLVLLSMGFLHVVHQGLVDQLGVKLDGRKNIAVDNWMTGVEGVFAAGDSVKGASLVVHAIDHGRLAAAAVDRWLKRS